MSINYLREGPSLSINELSQIVKKAEGLLSVAKNSEWRKQLENLKCTAQKLQALITGSEIQVETPPGSRSITIVETTLRRIIYDYVYKRPQYLIQMEWQSEFSKDKIIVRLEEKPFTQESLGYRLVIQNEPKK